MPILLITYTRLNVTGPEAEEIIGDGYRAVDAVEELSEGRPMETGRIYHFAGLGSSALIPRLEGNEHPQEDTEELARFMARISSRPGVSSVCQCTDRVHPAKWADGSDEARVSSQPPDGTEWNLRTISAHGPHARKRNGHKINIGIIDTGIARHTDLRVAGGVSFCDEDTDYRNDLFGHGTHCAGIAAGRLGGIAKRAKLYSIKVAHTKGAPAPAILAGLGWALRKRMNVVSISLAGSADLTMIPAFANAVQALMGIDCLVVASTGDSGDDVGFPANTPGIVAVGGCDDNYMILNGTCIGGKGNRLTVAAPGQNIKTTSSHARDGYIQAFSGSSAAAPHVAGLIALIQEAFPGITPLQVIGRILASARPMNPAPGTMGDFGGATLINCEEALAPLQHNSPRSKALPPRPMLGAMRTIEVNVTSDTAPNFPTYYCAVMIINCDTWHVNTQRQAINWPVPARFYNVPPGGYCIVAVPEGGHAHRTQFRTIDKTSGVMPITFDLSIADPVGRITVTVLVGDEPAPNESVSVTIKKSNDSGYTRTAKTGESGIAVFADLPEKQSDDTWQEYVVTVSHGSQSQEAVFNFSDGKKYEMKFKFPPDPQ